MCFTGHVVQSLVVNIKIIGLKKNVYVLDCRLEIKSDQYMLDINTVKGVPE